MFNLKNYQMENIQNIPTRSKVVVAVDDLRHGDVIYLSQKDDAVPYQVLDIGKPFILIENMRNHFANLYRPIVIYKEV